jgi:hypothetical protein
MHRAYYLASRNKPIYLIRTVYPDEESLEFGA